MMITRLEPVNGKKYRVYLNDAPAFLLYSSEITQYHLRENQELDEQSEKEIYSAVLPRRAKLRCMNLLKTMDKTEEQLRQKLRQGEYPEPVIEEALEYVKRYRYVDDFSATPGITSTAGRIRRAASRYAAIWLDGAWRQR